MAQPVQHRHTPPLALPRGWELVVATAPLNSRVNLSRLLRAAGCCGVRRLITCGNARIDREIARDAADWVQVETRRSLPPVLAMLREEGYELVALEQARGSICLYDFPFAPRTALVIGNERRGLEASVLERVDRVAEIPIYGMPHAHNAATAAAIAMYEYCRGAQVASEAM